MQASPNAARHPSRRARAQAGVTLIETTVVTSILAVVAGLATPSFDGMWQRRHLEGAATQLETDIHHTRMLAVARNEALRISFESVAGGSCYVIHRGDANQCGCNADGSARCEAGAEAERSVYFPAGGALALKANSRSIVFDPLRGTTTPTATVQLTTRSGMAVHQVVNVMGRVRSCSPAPAPSGYRPC
jgi:type IV fimbrial biogenesis protein FimT